MMPFAKIAALIVTCLALPQAASAQVRLETAAKVGVTGKSGLRPAQKAALREFRRSNDYYGAFYVSRGKDVWFAHDGASSLEAARFIARSGCERRARAACELHAVILPDGVNHGPKGKIDISGTLANVMDNRFRALQRGKWTAFAVAPHGAWGAANNYPRPSQAEAAALRQCRAGAAKARGEFAAPMARALAARGMFGCSTVLVLQK